MKLAQKILVSIAIMISISFMIYVPTSSVLGKTQDSTQEQDNLKVHVSEPSYPAVSRPISEIPSRKPEATLNREINPIRNPGLFKEDLGLPGSNTKNQDPLVELSRMSTGRTPDPTFTFEGLGTDGFAPPDTMGEVGPNHYVQMVNVSFAIYDKSGNVLVADTTFTDLFAGSGLSACSSQNNGDPVVLWDSMADRWLLSQFAVDTSPEHMCIAISQTSDPTGAYYLYEFEVPAFPDYFKFGVWPDAYYMGTNTGYPNQYFAYAFDREAMLAGLPATYQYSSGHPNFLLPADLDGPTPPAANTPGYFYTMLAEGYVDHPVGVDRLVLYEFDVDWDTPANTTFGIAQEIPIADYNYTVCGFFVGSCIPQPGTAQGLDAVDPWPMWRFVYRNLGEYEALVGNFTVDTNGSDHAGIRWFELQNSGSGWDLYQEGTHAPDDTHRWMGSIAIDGSGNIALGYSASSNTVYPSLRYASRLYNDPPGTLQAEATLYDGSGSQTGIHRWGDYSSLNVDPADECTFWYTGEYHNTDDTGFYWNTRIGTFRLPECTGTLADTGTLAGQVTDSNTSTPLAGAFVSASASITQTGSATTDVNGDYTITLAIDSNYTVMAVSYGYLPTEINNVSIISGITTTQDIALTPSSSYTVDGVVTDATTGWPLYAEISISGDPVNPPTSTIWTDPETGAYSVTLAEGITYTFEVEAWSGGYDNLTADVGPLTANETHDFALTADLIACSAPGYVDEGTALQEEFNTWPPADWTIVNNGGSCVWAEGIAAGNLTGGEGGFANADSDACGSGTTMDTDMISPVFDLSSMTAPSLEFDYDYFHFSTQVGSVEISTNGGSTWTELWSRTTVDRGPAHADIDISSYTGSNNTQLKYSFVSPGWNWWFQVDNVRVGETSNCVPQAGGLVVGNVYDGINLGETFTDAELTSDSGTTTQSFDTPGDSAVDDGFYILFSPAGSHTFTATTSVPNYEPGIETATVVQNSTIRLDFALIGPELAYSPAAIEEAMEFGDVVTNTVMLTNTSAIPLDWDVTVLGTSWATAVPNSGSIPAYSSVSIDVVFDSAGIIDPVTYEDELEFNGTFANNLPNMPLTMNLGCSTCGTLAGTITSLGYCDVNSVPAAGAAITAESSGGNTVMFTADGSGLYSVPLQAADSPYTVTVTAADHISQTVSNVMITTGETSTSDFDLRLDTTCVSVDPTAFDVTIALDSVITKSIDLTNNGARSTPYRIFEIDDGFTPAIVHIAASAGNFEKSDTPTSFGLAPTSEDKTTMPNAPGLYYPTGAPAFAINIMETALVDIPNVDLPGTINTIASVSSSSFYAGDFLNGDFTQLYSLNGGTDQLYSVNTADGSLTVIGSSVPNAGQIWTGMTGAVDGTMYAASTDCSTSTLYTIDVTSGALTTIGEITNGVCIIDIAINSLGDMYGVDITNDTLVQINTATGAGTVIGSVGIDANYAQGMDFEDVSGTLYWAAYSTAAEMRIIDTTTGNSALVDAFPVGTEITSFAIASDNVDVPWLATNPVTGTVNADSMMTLDVIFDSTVITQTGQYDAFLNVRTDDPSNTNIEIPITMTVVEDFKSYLPVILKP